MAAPRVMAKMHMLCHICIDPFISIQPSEATYPLLLYPTDILYLPISAPETESSDAAIFFSTNTVPFFFLTTLLTQGNFFFSLPVPAPMEGHFSFQ